MPRHKCPKRECLRQIDNRIFACNTHWWELSKPTRDAIYATKDLSILQPERRAVFTMAAKDWGES